MEVQEGIIVIDSEETVDIISISSGMYFIFQLHNLCNLYLNYNFESNRICLVWALSSCEQRVDIVMCKLEFWVL